MMVDFEWSEIVVRALNDSTFCLYMDQCQLEPISSVRRSDSCPESRSFPQLANFSHALTNVSLLSIMSSEQTAESIGC